MYQSQPIETRTVPAALYPIGDAAHALSAPCQQIALTSFAIMTYAVSNMQFMQFMAANGHKTDRYWTEAGLRWRETTHTPPTPFWQDFTLNGFDQPMVGVCWYEAFAFAQWLREETGHPWRLPAEVEWEAAARGHDVPPTGHIHTAAAQPHHTQAVDQGNQSWCGAVNLLGNVWEWCQTRWGKNWQTPDYRYPYYKEDGREDEQGSYARVMRGGSWFDHPNQSTVSARARFLPGNRASNIGFRLVHSL